MRIAIDTIPDDGIDVQIQLEQSWAASVAGSVLEAPAKALSGSLHVRRRGTSVQVEGRLQCAGARACERCDEPVVVTLDADVSLAYVPADHMAPGGSEVQLSAGDLDVGWFHGGALAMDDVVSEALALSLPTRIACADTAACDARISNLLAAAGDSAIHESPFAALKSRL